MSESEQPQIIVDNGTDPLIAKRIHMIDRAIHRSPERFQESVDNLGELATSQVIEIGDIDKRIVTATRKPDELITEFLNNRYDRDSVFDDATEEALAEDETAAELLAVMRSKTSQIISAGIMKKISRQNMDAPAARDEFRRYRLGFYIKRVIALQPPNTEGKGPDQPLPQLRSTG